MNILLIVFFVPDIRAQKKEMNDMDRMVDRIIKDVQLLCEPIFLNPTAKALHKRFPTISWWRPHFIDSKEERLKHSKYVMSAQTIYGAAKQWLLQNKALSSDDQIRLVQSLPVRKYRKDDEWLWTCVSHHVFALEYYEAVSN